jgi:hypothetical protein
MGATRVKQSEKGFGRNQDAKRLRKPEGVAQPGSVGPVQVAACFLMRRRVQNLMEGGSYAACRLRLREHADNRVECFSERQGKGMRGRRLRFTARRQSGG